MYLITHKDGIVINGVFIPFDVSKEEVVNCLYKIYETIEEEVTS